MKGRKTLCQEKYTFLTMHKDVVTPRPSYSGGHFVPIDHKKGGVNEKRV